MDCPLTPYYLLTPKNNHVRALIRIYNEWKQNNAK